MPVIKLKKSKSPCLSEKNAKFAGSYLGNLLMWLKWTF